MNPPEFSVCVYCGSRNGVRPIYRETADALGRAMAEEGWRLVYGAGDIGLMGTVADAANAADGRILGVIPIHLLRREVAKRDISQFVATETMHERKKVMFINADAIVVMPGGPGTMDEFFEVLTWRQLGLHSKPIILLSPDGYWSRLVDLIDHVLSEGFADPSLRSFFEVVETVDEAIALLRPAAAGQRDAVE